MVGFLTFIKTSGLWKPLVLAFIAAIGVAIVGSVLHGINERDSRIAKQEVQLKATDAYVSQLKQDIEQMKFHEGRVQVIRQKGDVITRTIEKIVVKRDLTDEEKDIVAVITSRIDRVQHTDADRDAQKSVSDSGSAENR